MPSSKKACRSILQLVQECEEKTGPIFELGSGWGNLLIPLARQYPERVIVGYELSIIPWLTTMVLKKLLTLDNIHVYRKNFLYSDLSHASIIICYLFPKGMQDLSNKINMPNHQLHYLISNNFALPTHQPSKINQIDDMYHSPIYLYTFNKADR